MPSAIRTPSRLKLSSGGGLETFGSPSRHHPNQPVQVWEAKDPQLSPLGRARSARKQIDSEDVEDGKLVGPNEVLKRWVVRERPVLGSPKVGVLQPGDGIDVHETLTDAKGRVWVRCDGAQQHPLPRRMRPPPVPCVRPAPLTSRPCCETPAGWTNAHTADGSKIIGPQDCTGGDGDGGAPPTSPADPLAGYLMDGTVRACAPCAALSGRADSVKNSCEDSVDRTCPPTLFGLCLQSCADNSPPRNPLADRPPNQSEATAAGDSARAPPPQLAGLSSRAPAAEPAAAPPTPPSDGSPALPTDLRSALERSKSPPPARLDTAIDDFLSCAANGALSALHCSCSQTRAAPKPS